MQVYNYCDKLNISSDTSTLFCKGDNIMFCQNCGQEIRHEKFCPGCGTSTNTQQRNNKYNPTDSYDQQQKHDSLYVENQSSKTPLQLQKTDKILKRTVIVFLIVILALISSGGLYWGITEIKNKNELKELLDREFELKRQIDLTNSNLEERREELLRLQNVPRPGLPSEIDSYPRWLVYTYIGKDIDSKDLTTNEYKAYIEAKKEWDSENEYYMKYVYDNEINKYTKILQQDIPNAQNLINILENRLYALKQEYNEVRRRIEELG